MTININLLPKKEKKKKTYIVAFLIIIFFVIAAVIFGYVYVEKLNKEMEQLTSEIEVADKLNTVYRENLAKMQANTQYDQLLDAIQWVETEGISHVFIMEELIKLLPERGFWLNYNDDGQSIISIRVQFDTLEESAYYLERMLAISWVEEAFISDVRQTNQTYGAVSIDRVQASFTIVYNQQFVREFLQSKVGEQ